MGNNAAALASPPPPHGLKYLQFTELRCRASEARQRIHVLQVCMPPEQDCIIIITGYMVHPLKPDSSDVTTYSSSTLLIP